MPNRLLRRLVNERSRTDRKEKIEKRKQDGRGERPDRMARPNLYVQPQPISRCGRRRILVAADARIFRAIDDWTMHQHSSTRLRHRAMQGTDQVGYVLG